MRGHADADAFMRKYLASPTDVTARLVFADWLEETGAPHNAAWAYYIRLKAEADLHDPGSRERRELEREADGYTRHIRANLTIPASLFVGYPRSLLQLLPAPNITVRLSGFEVPRAVLDLMPESFARENDLLPLDAQDGVLILAASNPRGGDTAQRLAFTLNRHVILVGAEGAEVQNALDRAYGDTVPESVDSVTYESPLVGLEGDPVSGHLFGVFHMAFSVSADSFVMEADATGCTVRYFAGRHTLREEHVSAEAYDRLLRHLHAQKFQDERTHHGIVSAELDVPLLSGRRFPVTLERPGDAGGGHWFRLRFRW